METPKYKDVSVADQEIASSSVSATEKQELLKLEGVVSAGLTTFVEVGNALATIRDARLYRQTHSTFEEYCRDRFDLSRSYAARLIEGATTASVLLPIGNTPPRSEAQVRHLRGLDPDAQQHAWRRAVEAAGGGEPTARHVAAAVTELFPPAKTGPPGRKQRQSATLAPSADPGNITAPPVMEAAAVKVVEPNKASSPQAAPQMEIVASQRRSKADWILRADVTHALAKLLPPDHSTGEEKPADTVALVSELTQQLVEIINQFAGRRASVDDVDGVVAEAVTILGRLVRQRKRRTITPGEEEEEVEFL